MFNNYTILQGVDRIVPVTPHPLLPAAAGGADGGSSACTRRMAGVPPAYERNGVAT
jgi:hypothetical protein